MNRLRTALLLRSALLASLMAAGALVAVPIGPIPVTLQVLVLAVATLALSPVEVLAGTALYLAVGAVGVPVFSGGGGGFGVLLGPTGGFLFGFVLGGWLGVVVCRTVSSGGRSHPVLSDLAALLVLLAVTYTAGSLRFMAVTGTGPAEAAALAVIPFLPVDLGKAAIALVVARALRAAGLADRPGLAVGEVC